MANPTTNFGWVMPTSASLVTNLPADFNTFGQAVDTSMAQLKGGTTGQILSKTSATDMAFTWVTPNPGDITAVTAGTGISGGGTSGDVTVTNAMATTITTKGDLVPGTGSGTFARLAVGNNGETLVADSSASVGLAYKTKGVFNGLTTTGDTIYSSSGTTQSRLPIGTTGQVLTVAGGVPSWATPASGSSFVGCSAYNSANLSVANSTWTTVLYDSERYDTDTFHSTSSNTSRFTIPTGKGGKYFISVTMTFGNNASGSRNAKLLVNGSDVRYLSQQSAPNSFIDTFGAVLSLSAADYVELQVLQTSGGALNLTQDIQFSWFDIVYLGA